MRTVVDNCAGQSSAHEKLDRSTYLRDERRRTYMRTTEVPRQSARRYVRSSSAVAVDPVAPARPQLELHHIVIA